MKQVRWLVLLIVFLVPLGTFSQAFTDFPTVGQDLNQWFQQVAPLSSQHYMEGIFFHSPSKQYEDQSPFYHLSWSKGSINYEGRQYENIFLLYNAYLDVLMVFDPWMKRTGQQFLKIDQEKTWAFSMEDEKFVNGNQVKDLRKAAGFYKELFVGKKVSAYIKHYKTERAELDGIKYDERKDFFLIYNSKTYRYSDKGSIMRLVAEDQKKALKKYIKHEVPDYKNKDEYSLIQVLVYLDKELK